LRELVDSGSAAPGVVLAPDRLGTGTNALVVPAGVNFETKLGPNSFELHRREAARLGLPLFVCRLPCLQLVIDTPADLEALTRWWPEWQAQAERDLLRLDLAAECAAGERQD